MNNYCGNCGNKLNEVETKCSKCGFDNKSVSVKKVDEEKRDKTKGNILALVAICFLFISIYASKNNSIFEPILFLITIFIVAYAMVAYPKSIFARILFILFMVMLGSYILSIVWLMLFCNGMARMCY